jgi:hypothetical protein
MMISLAQSTSNSQLSHFQHCTSATTTANAQHSIRPGAATPLPKMLFFGGLIYSVFSLAFPSSETTS